MWCISPVLAERVPHIMHNFRTTATENDYFAAADNGAGYIMPGMLQEPKVAAKRIVERVKERSALPFHWFRNILKQPTWYCEVMNEVKAQDDSIVLLDAPAFFELLRIYLKEHGSVIE